MKVSIYNEKPKEKEPEFLLLLVQDGSEVNLIMVDLDGDEVDSGVLLTITEDMKLRRISHINKTLGLPLNGNNQLELEEIDF